MTFLEDSAACWKTHPRRGEHLIEDLRPVLAWLDSVIQRAVTVADASYGSHAKSDPFRGLHIGLEDVDRLLATVPGEPVFSGSAEDFPQSLAEIVTDDSALGRLRDTFDLSPFDLAVCAIALGPEIDLRYERLYSYLQDDVTRKRPTVDLVLNLLCGSAREKIERRAHFFSDAPLISGGLLHLLADPNHVHPLFLAHYVKLDDQIVRLLLHQDSLDQRLVEVCEITGPQHSLDEVYLEPRTKQGLSNLVQRAWNKQEPLCVYFQGRRDEGKRQVAAALAETVGTRLLRADLARALKVHTDLEGLLSVVFREASCRRLILYLDPLDALLREDHLLQYESLMELLRHRWGITFVGGSAPWIQSGSDAMDVISVPFSVTDFSQRRTCWLRHTASLGMNCSAADLDALAGRFRLDATQIANAVTAARNQARWRAATDWPDHGRLDTLPVPSLKDLYSAARLQAGGELKALTRKVEPLYGWSDIVLPDETVAQLRAICQWVLHRQKVMESWGFHRTLSRGRGITALFTGPSGTGKTMAAEIIANDLGLDLYQIDLAGVVSKYIGETEKNLERIFNAATDSNAILLFDEADALFGKRSEVRDAHDRYANIEISYLLQKMEEYEGLAILTTNLRHNLDNAFTRRMAFTISFPYPDEESRKAIWSGIWPPETPIGKGVDLDFLSKRFKLSGGNIKNVALAAAFLAAENGSAVTMQHVLHATKREYQKMGKIWPEFELTGAAP